ncbi:hypothetical protein [Xenorhabdus sp. IM139775]|uniref:hypothetical protein n=1 Tax=Xenorhabdus sp. IM139775 TaxID=3025876 RepID=UPI0023581FDD|nr:hypothetical protein [Xenorhabdus sp. IM139775]MDC9594086.1 hypothetical protein [Xenorhabdus sp. IM139775]
MNTDNKTPSPIDLDKIERDIERDKEAGSGNRHLTGFYLKLTTILAIAISLYAIYANALSNTQEFYRNATFLAGILILGFILFPISQRYSTAKFNFWDYLFILLTLSSYGYFYLTYTDLHVVHNSMPNTTDYVMSVLGIAVLFEAGINSKLIKINKNK